ncbi:MAG: AMP-binding protein, partial [Myxococcota bacterium]
MAIDAGLRLQPDASRYTLACFLADVVERNREGVAVRFEGESFRYADLAEQAHAIAKGLVAAGLHKGSHVALLMANRPEWITAAFGISLVGGVVVPVNTFGTGAEIDTILRHSDAGTLILQRSLLKHEFLDDLLGRHDALREGVPGQIRCDVLPALRRAFCLGLDSNQGAVESWGALIRGGAGLEDALVDSLAEQVTPADDGILIYTSGTTAQPKGVLHRQRAAVIQSWRFAEHYGLGTEDVVWTAQPFFWTAGICMSLGASLAGGGTLVLQENFDAERALDAIEQEGATVIHAWPHQEKALADHPSAAGRDLSRVSKVNFSSPLAP